MKTHLAAHLQFRIPFFLGFKRVLINKIVDRLDHIICKPGDVFVRQGDIGDCMFIIYKGRVNVFLSE